MKERIIIIVGIIIILLIIGFGISNFFQFQKDKKLQKIEEQLKQEQLLKEKVKKDNIEKDKLIIEQNKRIEQLKKQKIITKMEYIILTDPEKEKTYNDLFDNYNEVLKIINDNKVIQDMQNKIIEEQGQIIQTDEKIIKELKRMVRTKKGIEIESIILGGVKYKDTNDIKFTLGIGGTISKIFDFKLFTFGIGGGGYGKLPIDNEKEFGAIINFKFGF